MIQANFNDSTEKVDLKNNLSTIQSDLSLLIKEYTTKYSPTQAQEQQIPSSSNLRVMQRIIARNLNQHVAYSTGSSDELSRYLNEPAITKYENFDILIWWK
jgi:hypothetical protein